MYLLDATGFVDAGFAQRVKSETGYALGNLNKYCGGVHSSPPAPAPSLAAPPPR